MTKSGPGPATAASSPRQRIPAGFLAAVERKVEALFLSFSLSISFSSSLTSDGGDDDDGISRWVGGGVGGELTFFFFSHLTFSFASSSPPPNSRSFPLPSPR